jgi:hypothetical protein
MRTPASVRALFVSACVVCTIAAFGLALWTYTGVAMYLGLDNGVGGWQPRRMSAS